VHQVCLHYTDVSRCKVVGCILYKIVTYVKFLKQRNSVPADVTSESLTVMISDLLTRKCLFVLESFLMSALPISTCV